MIGEEVIAIWDDGIDGAELYEVQKLVRCKDCLYCEQDLIVERTNDGYERKINLCHISKPPKVVELHHYCGYGERIDNE